MASVASHLSITRISVDDRVKDLESGDLEKMQTLPTLTSSSIPPCASGGDPAGVEAGHGLGDNLGAPRLSPWKIFWLFFSQYGIFAWGGPVAQIALLKDGLVTREKWITSERFTRVFAVYQILPGPEAAELAMFFGCLAGGRLGGVMAGLGFIMPGFVLMLLASYLYVVVGFGNTYVNSSFRALQPIVSAMILRATHKIADHVFHPQGGQGYNLFLCGYAFFTALNSALRINWFISLGLYGIIHMVITRGYRIAALALFILQYVGYTLYVVFHGVPSPVSLALGIAKVPDLLHLFLLGLVAGSLSFGGAYTAIPFVQAEAVLLGKWLPQQVFLDCIAIGNILPAPLVIFATFVGFQGGHTLGGLGYAFAGATLATLGMFFPCFLFTIAGHDLLERLVHNKFLAAFFDGLCGSVVGVISIVALDMLKQSVGSTGRSSTSSTPLAEQILITASQDAVCAVLYLIALVLLYKYPHKYASIAFVVVGALAGQFLFV